VVKPVPSGSVVVGVPGQVIARSRPRPPGALAGAGGVAPSSTVPCVASTVTSSLSRSFLVASPVPTTQGMRSSRETIAA